MEEKKLPWQITASKLISFSKEIYKHKDDFSRQVSYLLLDVGVETMLKVYLLAPYKETKFEFNKRVDIVKGIIKKDEIVPDKDKVVTLVSLEKINFHKLVETVIQVTDSLVKEEDLKSVEYFHGIRNKIYHDGDGVVPTQNNFDEYLKIAESLLPILLNSPNKDAIFRDTEVADTITYLEIDYAMREAFKKESYEELCYDILIATAHHRPKYVLRSFEEEVETIMLSNNVHLVPNYLDRPNYQNQHIIEDFSKLIGKEINDIEFIEEVFKDINYLRLAVLLSQINGNNDDLDIYVRFRDHVKTGIIPLDKWTADEIKQVEELWLWRDKIHDQINNWINSKIN